MAARTGERQTQTDPCAKGGPESFHCRQSYRCDQANIVLHGRILRHIDPASFPLTPHFSAVMSEGWVLNRFNGLPLPQKPLKRFKRKGGAGSTGLKPGVNGKEVTL